MFDISFSELLVIALVALVVIGPEKLPKVARTAGAFFGRLQRLLAQVKDEVNREARFAELQKLQDEVKSTVQQEFAEVERQILPATPDRDAEAVNTAPVIAEKKARKPRQRKSALSSDTAQAAPALDSVAVTPDAPPQAELFAEAAPAKPVRRARKASPKSQDAAPDVASEA